jgi:hypothetical protein
VHHTWSPEHRHFNGTNGIELQENMKRYHLSLGWSDIGQHVTLLPDGLFVTGRNFMLTPASIQGYNTGAFAVEMLGNFDTGHDKFEGKQKDSMLKLAKYFITKGRYIRFHRENAPKTCPGTSIDKEVFMNEVKGYGEKRYYIQTGSFNTLPEVQEALKKYFTDKGLYGGIKFYIESGYFNSREDALTVKDALSKDGLWGDIL